VTTEQLLGVDAADAADDAKRPGGAMPPLTDKEQEPAGGRLSEAEARALLRKHSKSTAASKRDPLEGEDDSDPLLSHAEDAERDPLGDTIASARADGDDEPDGGKADDESDADEDEEKDKAGDKDSEDSEDADRSEGKDSDEDDDAKDASDPEAEDTDEPLGGRKRLNIFRKNEHGEYVHSPRERAAMQHADEEGIGFLEAWHRLFGGLPGDSREAGQGNADAAKDTAPEEEMSSDEIHRKIQDLRQQRKQAAAGLDAVRVNDITEQIEDLLDHKGAALQREAERGHASRRAAEQHDQAQTASMERAGTMFPHAVKEGSNLHSALTREIARIEKANPAFFRDPDWPEMLTAKLANRMGIAPILVKATASLPVASAPIAPKPVAPKQAARPAPAPGGISGAPRQTNVQDYLKKLAAARDSGNPAEIARLMGMAKELDRQRARGV